jgi:hypothetical protein
MVKLYDIEFIPPPPGFRERVGGLPVADRHGDVQMVVGLDDPRVGNSSSTTTPMAMSAVARRV